MKITDVPRQKLSDEVLADKEILFYQTLAEGRYQ